MSNNDEPVVKRADGKQGLTKKDLNTLWYRWQVGWFSSSSYEKLESHGFAWSYVPFAEKFYKDDPEGKKRLLTRHSQFYNTEPQVGTIVNGIVAALEEGIALGDPIPEEMPTSVKTALMGPLAGLGDSLIQGIIVPTLLSIGMSLSSDGSVAGPIFYVISWLCIGLLISYGMFRYGYKMGLGAIDTIVGEKSMHIMDAINVLGIIVVGTLAAGKVTVSTVVQIPHGSEMGALQDTLDGVFPGLLALIVTLATWWMLNKKQWSATKVLLVLCVAVIVLCCIGFL
jgi:mannose/fructose/N-acetylgalactosamine-specific phosphotransferase system component IID